jgi:predicted dehydrogenase
VERTYTDHRSLLDGEELDAALVTGPHGLHFEHARDALLRGLHVLVEKPLGVSAEQAWALVHLAQEKGLVLSTALNPPFWSHCHFLRSRLAAGEIGRVEGLEITMVGSVEHVFGRAPMPDRLPGVVPPTLFRADPTLCGGGNLMDSGAHLVSELLWVLNQSADSVSAWMDDVSSDMRAVLTVALNDGPTATITAIGDSHYPERRVRSIYYGSAGTATVDGLPFRVTLTRHGGLPETCGEREMPPAPGPVANFVDAILGRAPLAAPPEHGADTTRVLEAAYESARTGMRVELG